MYNHVPIEINRTYWEYSNGSFLRPSDFVGSSKDPTKNVKVNVPRYITKGPNIKYDLHGLAIKFHEKFNSKYVLALSGGIDSEVTAETFYRLGIPFEAVSLRLFDGRNDFDLEYAKNFCKARDIPHNIINLSLDKFLEYTIPNAQKLGQFTHSMSQVALTEIVDNYTDEILVFSGHNPDYLHSIESFGWWEDSPNLVKYCINTNKKFFTFTSLEPIYLHYVKAFSYNMPGHKDNSFIYNQYTNLVERPKYTGWEQANDIYYEYFRLMRKNMKWQVFITWK